MQPTPSPDIVLIERLQANDATAFDELFNTYWEPLYKAAFKRLHSRPEAEDMVQEVLTSVWQRRATLKTHGNSSLGGYLFTALKYRIISFYAEIKPERFQGEVLEKLLLMQTDDQYSQLITGELNTLLQQEISSMPENMQRAYHLLRVEDHSVKEVAAILGLSEQTVKNLASLSGKRLRKIVEQYYTGHAPETLCIIALIVLNKFR
jgi:RNA polymerase sigma-70 factor (ECF subfamily)